MLTSGWLSMFVTYFLNFPRCLVLFVIVISRCRCDYAMTTLLSLKLPLSHKFFSLLHVLYMYTFRTLYQVLTLPHHLKLKDREGVRDNRQIDRQTNDRTYCQKCMLCTWNEINWNSREWNNLVFLWVEMMVWYRI